MTGRGRGVPKPRSAAFRMFESALGRPVDSPEVHAVVAALGGVYQVRTIDRGIAGYDPDLARTVAWDFTDAPRVNRFAASNIGVRDDKVVWLTVAQELVDGSASGRAASFTLPSDERGVYKPWGEQWSWAPEIIRRGESFLLSLDVPRGRWDGNYKFPLTSGQVERLQGDDRLYREVWEGLVHICQSRRFLDDPSTLPEDAHAFLEARCGRG